VIPILVIAAIVDGVASLYFAVRSIEFRKFLAGAFFVSAGMQFYFFIANVPIPLVGTNIVQTPEISGIRSIVHFILFGICFYFGLLVNERKPSSETKWRNRSEDKSASRRGCPRAVLLLLTITL
jgi:hypothetical protein